jgi:phosphoribosylformylglycinamidine cyclo-ligase
VGEVLLEVHRSYLSAVGPVLAQGRVHALAHITGGGIPGNLSRVIPDDLTAVVDLASWNVPAAFRGVMEAGDIEELEMYRTFNMGAGMILVVSEAGAAETMAAFRDSDEEPWIMGSVERRDGREAVVLA